MAALANLAGVLFCPAAHAQQSNPEPDTNLLAHTLIATSAGDAWLELQRATHRPPTPPAWNTAPPSIEEQKRYFLPYILAASDKARDFYTKFPKALNIPSAPHEEYDLLTLAIQIGATNQEARLDNLEKNILSDPTLPEDDRFKIRQHSVERAAASREADGSAAVMETFEKGARALQKDFPGRPEVMQMLMIVASSSDAEKARAITKEIEASNAPDTIKEMAANLDKKLQSVGKPIQLQFTAVDGHAVDLSTMKGKVVLVDFWATWCAPCVAELPHVKEAYGQLHGKGFEIVGISLDSDTQKLTTFTTKNKMEWPQFCDGRGWDGKYPRQFGVTSIPAMWLVDKNGLLRDINGRAELREKVEKLLAE